MCIYTSANQLVLASSTDNKTVVVACRVRESVSGSILRSGLRGPSRVRHGSISPPYPTIYAFDFDISLLICAQLPHENGKTRAFEPGQRSQRRERSVGPRKSWCKTGTDAISAVVFLGSVRFDYGCSSVHTPVGWKCAKVNESIRCCISVD